jgi:precorrin-6Y C5,15-methyltransferase (decarboxylating)
MTRTLPLNQGLTDWLAEARRISDELQLARETPERAGASPAKNNLVILADGDPNFFGLGARVIEAFAGYRVIMKPAPTTIQKAFARLGVSWAGVEVVSLHGRKDYGPFFSAVFRAGHKSGSGRLAVYTDAGNNPAKIASLLLGRGQDHWRLIVFQDLGLPEESVWTGTLAEAVKTTFSPLNLAVLELVKAPESLTIGAPESAYDHQAGLITKSEVRTAVLGLLELTGSETMWDLGCGSGSVSLEAALILRQGRILAVEKDPLRAKQARENRSRYGAAHLEIIEGQALEALPDLPRPDRVFVGGGGQQLEALLSGALGFLLPGGVLVAAVVRLDSLNTAIMTLSSTGQPVTVTQIAAARGAALAESLFLKPINPVFLIKGRVPN